MAVLRWDLCPNMQICRRSASLFGLLNRILKFDITPFASMSSYRNLVLLVGSFIGLSTWFTRC